jgi:hypothetical protein
MAQPLEDSKAPFAPRTAAWQSNGLLRDIHDVGIGADVERGRGVAERKQWNLDARRHAPDHANSGRRARSGHRVAPREHFGEVT